MALTPEKIAAAEAVVLPQGASFQHMVAAVLDALIVFHHAELKGEPGKDAPRKLVLLAEEIIPTEYSDEADEVNGKTGDLMYKLMVAKKAAEEGK